MPVTIESRPNTVMNHGMPAAGRRPSDAPVLLRTDAQRGEVRDRLRDGTLEVVPVGAQLGHSQLPGGERVTHVLELLAEPPLGRLGMHDVAGRRGHDVDHELPALTRFELDRVRRPRPLHEARRLREDHLGRGRAGRIRQQELAFLGVEARLGERRQRRRLERVAEREVVRLDREDVREIRADLQREPGTSPAPRPGSGS